MDVEGAQGCFEGSEFERNYVDSCDDKSLGVRKIIIETFPPWPSLELTDDISPFLVSVPMIYGQRSASVGEAEADQYKKMEVRLMQAIFWIRAHDGRTEGRQMHP